MSWSMAGKLAGLYPRSALEATSRTQKQSTVTKGSISGRMKPLLCPSTTTTLQNNLILPFSGFNGINSVTLARVPSPIDSRVIKTTEVLSEFLFSIDMNRARLLALVRTPNKLSEACSQHKSGWGQMTVKNGSRSSSATSYLGPKFIRLPNLHVLLHARITRVLQTASKDFRTVEFGDTGQPFTLTARKEIVLSAGSIGTPVILMYSGVGNSLKALGIKPLHNLPAIGQNLTD
ncbi:GMC oxidoreductase-domain-containing protein, partial [Mycena vulgaris]